MPRKGQFQPKEKGYASSKQLYHHYKKRAIKRGISFGIEFELFRELTSMDCFYCGVKPLQVFSSSGLYNGDYIYNGIDRIDSFKGYETDNCRPCCKTCNYMKQRLSEKEFVSHIENILVNLYGDKKIKNIRRNSTRNVRKP